MSEAIRRAEAAVFWLLVAWGVMSLFVGIVAVIMMEWETALGQFIAVLFCLVIVPLIRGYAIRKRHHRYLRDRAREMFGD